jgi:hypothetical protein
MAEAYDLALVVEGPQVDLLVPVVTTTPGGRIHLQRELHRDLVAPLHHVEDLEVDDLHLTDRLEEVDARPCPAVGSSTAARP